MAKRKVFFSYYYEKDGNKVDDIRGMGPKFLRVRLFRL